MESFLYTCFITFTELRQIFLATDYFYTAILTYRYLRDLWSSPTHYEVWVICTEYKLLSPFPYLTASKYVSSDI